MQAKKRFGQNFLKDSTILQKIIESMSYDNRVIEIGPGLGDLTRELLKVTNVKAYEIDDDLSVLLKRQFIHELESKRLKLVEQDVLKEWEKGSLEDCNYDIVANLPYYISTAIILRALKDEMCKNLTVMIQKEVALKFSANSKQKEFCPLSILSQSIAKVDILFDVPPSAFEPQPKVTSSVIKFNKFQEYNEIFGVGEFERFEKFLKCAFSQPRKTLMKNLSQYYPKRYLKSIFEKINLPLQIRGHEVDTKRHHHLYKMITKVMNDEQSKQRDED